MSPDLGREVASLLISTKFIAEPSYMRKKVSSKHKDELKTAIPTNIVSFHIDRFILFVGKAASWLWLAVLVVVLYNVFSRYVFNSGSTAIQELSWHLFGAATLLVISYAVVTDDHVRVDFLSEKIRREYVAGFELLMIGVLVIPLLFFMIENLANYALTSFIRNESSQAPDGLPYRFLIKSVIPIALVLLVVALVSRMLKITTFIFCIPNPLK